jgi:hypothetical protein
MRRSTEIALTVAVGGVATLAFTMGLWSRLPSDPRPLPVPPLPAQPVYPEWKAPPVPERTKQGEHESFLTVDDDGEYWLEVGRFLTEEDRLKLSVTPDVKIIHSKGFPGFQLTPTSMKFDPRDWVEKRPAASTRGHIMIGGQMLPIPAVK